MKKIEELELKIEIYKTYFAHVINLVGANLKNLDQQKTLTNEHIEGLFAFISPFYDELKDFCIFMDEDTKKLLTKAQKLFKKERISCTCIECHANKIFEIFKTMPKEDVINFTLKQRKLAEKMLIDETRNTNSSK